METTRKRLEIAVLPAFALLLMLVLAGCTTPPAPVQNATNHTNNTNNTLSSCASPECFITAANNCENASILFTNEVGAFNYTSSRCVFTKTLVALNASETEDMKKALEGKSMSCKYEKGKFDSRLVKFLIFGMENCEGGLKDALAELIAFT